MFQFTAILSKLIDFFFKNILHFQIGHCFSSIFVFLNCTVALYLGSVLITTLVLIEQESVNTNKMIDRIWSFNNIY